MRKALLILVAAAIAVAAALALHRPAEAPAAATVQAAEETVGEVSIKGSANEVAAPEGGTGQSEIGEADGDSLVDAFDALTDRWTAPLERGVSVDDAEAFVEQFRKVPRRRRNECLQRAMNLIPEENAMLLAGILMDRTQESAIARSAFAYIVNCDESVKNPVMRRIFEDRSHPCNADVAWIYEVTGEMPEEEGSGAGY